MKKNYLFTLVLTLCFSAVSFGQSTLKFQDFESGSDDWSYSESPATYNQSSDVWALVSSVGNIPSAQNGSSFWGMRDLENNNGGTADDHTLTFSNVDVSGKTNVEVSFFYYTVEFDGTDYLKVEIFHDDVSQGIEELAKDTSGEWTSYTKSVPDNVNNVKLTIIAKQNGGSDYAGVDNFKVRDGVAPSCGFNFGTSIAICDTFTGGVDTSDTYNISLPYTGGGAGLSVSVTAGTAAGDDPATVASGVITISNITEGTNVTVTVSGDGLCDEDLVVNSPYDCVVPKTLPIYESFDQAVGSDLSAAPYWINASNSTDEIKVVASAIANPYSSEQFPDPINNSVNFAGVGSDSYIVFPETSAGVVYSSFIFSVTDVTTLTKAAGGYFAALTTPNGSFASRLWIKADTAEADKFKIGVSSGSAAEVYETNLHVANEAIFVVLGYDFTTNEVKVWINPDHTTFGGAVAPASTLTDAAEEDKIPENLGRFLIRQDSGTETPEINLDELRISTSWADVAPSGATASLSNNTIEGFSIYPNPVNNNTFTITSNSNSKKAFAVFNLLGKQVLSSSFTGVKSDVDVSNISSGMYILKVTEDGKTATKKLVIK